MGALTKLPLFDAAPMITWEDLTDYRGSYTVPTLLGDRQILLVVPRYKQVVPMTEWSGHRLERVIVEGDTLHPMSFEVLYYPETQEIALMFSKDPNRLVLVCESALIHPTELET